MPHHLDPPTAIAILGANTVVGSALALLLEGQGNEGRLLEAPSAGVAVNGLVASVARELAGASLYPVYSAYLSGKSE